ncbi:hypothetical protein DOY81_011585 [Sarcophaga bullata]|nr:hypothetical protein DOY81_011585 [Sarcophaga bullata]
MTSTEGLFAGSVALRFIADWVGTLILPPVPAGFFLVSTGLILTVFLVEFTGLEDIDTVGVDCDLGVHVNAGKFELFCDDVALLLLLEVLKRLTLDLTTAAAVCFAIVETCCWLVGTGFTEILGFLWTGFLTFVMVKLVEVFVEFAVVIFPKDEALCSGGTELLFVFADFLLLAIVILDNILL